MQISQNNTNNNNHHGNPQCVNGHNKICKLTNIYLCDIRITKCKVYFSHKEYKVYLNIYCICAVVHFSLKLLCCLPLFSVYSSVC